MALGHDFVKRREGSERGPSDCYLLPYFFSRFRKTIQEYLYLLLEAKWIAAKLSQAELSMANPRKWREISLLTIINKVG